MKRTEMQVKDLMPPTEIGMATYGKVEMLYRQESNNLHYFPELLYLFDLGVRIEKGDFWNHFRLLNVTPDNAKECTRLLHNAFEACENITIVMRRGIPEVTSLPYWRDEDFKTYRNRTLFSIRDYLGMTHYGRGKDSIRLPSNHW